MDKSGRESVTTFERGIGDVIVTYENELLPRIKSGRPYELVLPPRTLLIENPAAVVDKHADRHKVRDIAQAFVGFLHTEQAQQAFVESGFRRISDAPSPGIFTISDLGGWNAIAAHLFGPRGVWTQTVEELAREH
jgi:sulfate transport system substrate-binding protein